MTTLVATGALFKDKKRALCLLEVDRLRPGATPEHTARDENRHPERGKTARKARERQGTERKGLGPRKLCGPGLGSTLQSSLLVEVEGEAQVFCLGLAMILCLRLILRARAAFCLEALTNQP